MTEPGTGNCFDFMQVMVGDRTSSPQKRTMKECSDVSRRFSNQLCELKNSSESFSLSPHFFQVCGHFSGFCLKSFGRLVTKFSPGLPKKKAFHVVVETQFFVTEVENYINYTKFMMAPCIKSF